MATPDPRAASAQWQCEESLDEAVAFYQTLSDRHWRFRRAEQVPAVPLIQMSVFTVEDDRGRSGLVQVARLQSVITVQAILSERRQSASPSP